MGDEERRRRRHVDPVGHLDRARLGDDDTFGHPTEPDRTDDAVADGQSVDAGTDGADDTGDLAAGENGNSGLNWYRFWIIR